MTFSDSELRLFNNQDILVNLFVIKLKIYYKEIKKQ